MYNLHSAHNFCNSGKLEALRLFRIKNNIQWNCTEWSLGHFNYWQPGDDVIISVTEADQSGI